jgi:hypothetical protein
MVVIQDWTQARAAEFQGFKDINSSSSYKSMNSKTILMI